MMNYCFVKHSLALQSHTFFQQPSSFDLVSFLSIVSCFFLSPIVIIYKGRSELIVLLINNITNMQFVSAQSQEDQISDIVAYLVENFRASVENQKSQVLEDFEDRLEFLNSKRDVSGLLDYLISLKEVIVKLPISHKNTPITIQRIVLLILPLLKLQDEKIGKDV